MAEAGESESDILVHFRTQMLAQIRTGGDCKDILRSLVQANVSSFTSKYALLNVASLLHMNNQNIQSLMQIAKGLSLIVKYSLCLLNPLASRRKNWRIFPFNHVVVRDKITPLIGYDTILNQLGYVCSTDHGLSFAPNAEPNQPVVANLIIDMMLFKAEVKEYLRGHHPLASEIDEFLPQDTVDEVKAYEISLQINSSGFVAEDDLISSDENPFDDKANENGVPVNHQCDINSPESVLYDMNPTPSAPKLVMGESDFNSNKMPQNPLESSGEVTLPSSSSATMGNPHSSSSSSFQIACDVCGGEAQVFCRDCSKKPLCNSCSEQFHKHPNRRGHIVEAINNLADVSLESQPQIQVEGAYGIMAQSQSQAMRLNKSQETAVIKSPAKSKGLTNNMPAFGLLGFNSVDESVSENAFPIERGNSQLKGHDQFPHRVFHDHYYGGGFDETMTPHQQTPLFRPNNPNMIEPPLYYPPHHDPLAPMPTMPYLPMATGPSQFTDAQLSFNAAKMRMGHTLPSPQDRMQGGPQSMPVYHQGPATQWQRPPLAFTTAAYPYMTPPTYRMSDLYGPGSRPIHNQRPYGTVGPEVQNSVNLSRHSMGNSHYGPPKNNVEPINRERQSSQFLHNPSYNVGGFPDHRLSQTSMLPINPSLPLSLRQPPDLISALHTNSLISEKLQRIMSIPDMQQQVKSCKVEIQEMTDAVKEMDEEINMIMVSVENHLSNSNFIKLNSRKAAFLKEKQLIEKYLKQLTKDGDPPNSRKIYFPPTITPPPATQSLSLHGSDKNTNFRVSGHETSCVEKNSQDKCASNVEVPSTLPTVSKGQSEVTFKTSQKLQTPKETGNELHSQMRKIPREPVESSSLVEMPMKIPPLPPRKERKSPELEDILEKTFPPPSPSKVKAESKNMKWQCEHCTFVNQASSHACEVCSKTSDNPQLIEDHFESEEIAGSPGGNDDPGPSDPLLDLLLGTENEIQEPAVSHFNFSQSSRNKIIDYQDQVMQEKKLAQQEFASSKENSDLHQLSPRTPRTSSPIGHPRPSISPFQEEQSPSSTRSPRDSPELKKASSSSTLNDMLGMAFSSPQESALKALARRREMEANDQLKKDGKELLNLIKVADSKGFKVEAVEIAQICCKSLNLTPMQWLEENWNKYLEKIMNQVLRAGSAEAENCIGELSQEEAETAFIHCHGNVNEAIQLAVDKRRELYACLSSMGSFPREEILRAMYSEKGEGNSAIVALIRLQLQPIVDRVWDNRESESQPNYGLNMYAQPEYYNSFSNSIIGHDDFQRMVKNKDLDKNRRTRMIMVEGKLKSWGRASLVIKILDEDLADVDLALEDVVEAVRNCHDRLSAVAYLQQECRICFETYPMSKIRNLNFCPCKMCQECLTKNFEIVIREKHIRYWTCPICSQPDLSKDEITWDYLHFLSLLLRPLVQEDVMNIFETKVRDLHLQRDKNFLWCAHCAEGFLAENPNQYAVPCLYCQKKTCYRCRKQWEAQHEGLTCEQFAHWKIENDPKNQAVGLAKHLEENGIDCPSCKMRFALAKGGCMHFHCPECGFEFCSGCSEAYYKAGVCTKYKSCGDLGLHCHHPRDCFSYLRDRSVDELQSLLKHHQINFNVKTPEDQEDATHCPVMEQKESGSTKKDEQCGKNSADGQAGLCESHYKEYLTGLINTNCLDPLFLMDVKDMTVLLNRHDRQIPVRGDEESEADYKAKLNKIIAEKQPLKRKYVKVDTETSYTVQNVMLSE